MSGESRGVEVGVLTKLPPDEGWRLESRFFPSKVGGRPAWLDLKNLTPPADLTCGVCLKPAAFLCQVYAPVDERDDAHHRTIFVFVCKDENCCHLNRTDNMKVFRCQLPKVNEFYPQEEPVEDVPTWAPESKIERFSSTCRVCGCAGSYHCGKCKAVKYCSKAHQVLDWKSGHNQTCGTSEVTSKGSSSALFPEYEIAIESEFESDDEDEDKMPAGDGQTADDEDRIKKLEKLFADGKGGTMQDVPAETLEQYACGKEDKFFKNYRSRLKVCPDQVLRYDLGGEPLWIADPTPEPNVPNCDICNGPRQFEFQILSTMVGYLDVDKLGKSLDWGNILVYTCKNHCSGGPSYKREFLWKQDVV